MEPEKASTAESGAASPLSGMLSTLLSNPEMLKQIQSVFGNAAPGSGMHSEAPADAAATGQPAQTPPPQQSAPASAGLESLLAGLAANGVTLGGDQKKEPDRAMEAAPAGTGSPGKALPADGLATVLANPDLMAKLPQMMAVLGPMLGGEAGKPKHHEPQHTHSPEECRNDLLLALKPFLSHERRNAVDTILRIAKLGSVLRQIK